MRPGGYPCWLYNAAGARLFQSEAEHLAALGDWYESPADVPAEMVIPVLVSREEPAAQAGAKAKPIVGKLSKG